MIPTFDVDRDGWGARHTVYDHDDPPFLEGVSYVVVHWGGGTAQIPADSEDDRLRIWQAYHIDSKGWTDIAYNYAFGDSGLLYRCRGLNPGGHTSTAKDKDPSGTPYNRSSLGIVWVGGANDPDGPSDAAFGALARFINSLNPVGVIVKGHRTVKQENGSWTACPGEDVLAWIDSRGWESEAMQGHANDGEMRATHNAGSIPDWAGWENYLEAGGSTVPDSGSWPAWRYDLAWIYNRFIEPLQNRTTALEMRVAELEAANPPSSTVPDHTHEQANTGGVVQ